MMCPNCGSDNVNVTTEQMGSVTNTKKKGCLFLIFRLVLIVCTLGLWLLLGKKKSKSKTTIHNHTVAICQNCGNKWDV